MAQKVISFFRKSAREYSDIPGMSAETRKAVRTYKKLFDAVSEQNQGNNALSIELKDAGMKKSPVTNIIGENMHVTGDNDEEAPATTNTDVDTDTRFALIGRTEDGRGIYRTNYPKNTHKDVKQKDIVDLVQNVWSKKPIKLNLIVDGKEAPIEARFNPELTERSDLSKIAFGNRKGTNSEKRITLDLSSDLYQIAEESHHVGSKTETGKDNPAHFGVSEWHYFLTNLVFVEDDGTNVDCYMNIDVKQNDSGHWFYSFAIEKGTAPRTLLAGVTEESATVPDNSIPQNAEKSNIPDKNSSKKVPMEKMALAKTDSDGNALTPEQREYFADSKVLDENGNLLVVYHGTPNAEYTALRKGTYFTEHKWYADRYQSQGASSLGYKKTANKPDTYSGYLNITKPFDTRNEEAREIWYNEYYRQWGTGTDLMESGLPDWMDGEDLIEFLEENGYDYDGLILDEGGTGGYGDAVISRGVSYVIFEPNQFKRKDNKNPTADPDMRFALAEDTEAIANYTEKQYNSFGWVRANDVISAGHWKTFTTNFADAIARGYYFNKTPAGEFMIEAYNYYDSLSEADVIVFAKGTIENPIISKIVKINITQGIDIEAKRSILYEAEGRGIQPTTGDVFRFYYKTDYTGKFKHGRNGEEGNRNNNRFNVKRSASEIKTNPIIKFYVNEDENTVTYRYANGEIITESLDEPTNSKYALADDPFIDEVFGDVVADQSKIDFDPKLVLERGSPRRPGASTLTVGEMKKTIANNTHFKVYSKKTALKVIKNMYGVSDLSPKTVSELSDAPWQGLNDCTDSESRAAFAHDMAEFITAKLVTEAILLTKQKTPKADKLGQKAH